MPTVDINSVIQRMEGYMPDNLDDCLGALQMFIENWLEMLGKVSRVKVAIQYSVHSLWRLLADILSVCDQYGSAR
jgi:hypothetical protein